MGFEDKTFKNGEIIIKEGDIGKSFFWLAKGSAHVYANQGAKDQIKLGTIEEGEFFGEMAILEEYPRSATVVAKGPVQAVEIPGDEMKGFFEANPDTIIELMKHLGSRIKSMTKDYEDAKALLSQLKEADEGKKKTLFSKIKKHMDVYQANKNRMNDPGEGSIREDYEKIRDLGSDNVKSYRKGMYVFKEGKVDNSMYILLNGTVGFFTGIHTPDEMKIDEISDFAFFGETGLVFDEARDTTAVVDTDDTKVEIIRREDLESIYKTCPDKIILILRHMSYRVRRLNIDFLRTCKEITENYDS
ncbi:MAG: cyclic nucleotide-binding domain-containing protein [Clostridiales bacterium]|nr:cyclic nucleotide-binding domain-containing protein [Clostridiales bacterium]